MYEIRVLDQEFKTVAQATTSSKIMPPALLNEGQVQLLAKPNKQYRLAFWRPQNGETTTVARFPSGCIPEVSSFAPDLLLVGTCELNTGVHEYRVLRSDGKVVLRGRTDPAERWAEVGAGHRTGLCSEDPPRHPDDGAWIGLSRIGSRLRGGARLSVRRRAAVNVCAAASSADEPWGLCTFTGRCATRRHRGCEGELLRRACAVSHWDAGRPLINKASRGGPSKTRTDCFSHESRLGRPSARANTRIP